MPALTPVNDPYQGLRLRRFLAASAIYLALITLGGLYVLIGLMALADWVLVSGAIVAVNLLLFCVLRSGRNEQFGDPSLTVIQMLSASLLIATMAFHVAGGRGGVLLILMTLMMFAAFRLRVPTFLLVGGFAITCFGAVITSLYHLRPESIEWRVAVIHLVALVIVLPCGALFVSYAGNLRRQLRSRQLDLQRANEAVHELSIQDGLTGVHNRGEIVRLVEQERARAERLDTSLTVAMLDLDRFKEINSRYTHATGDAILKRVAQVVYEGLRAVDALGRYGGEEFLVILPDTSLDGGRESMDRLSKLLTSRPLRDLPEGLTLSVSVGVASHRTGDDTETLIERARRCADWAFEAGGGQVVTDAAFDAA